MGLTSHTVHNGRPSDWEKDVLYISSQHRRPSPSTFNTMIHMDLHYKSHNQSSSSAMTLPTSCQLLQRKCWSPAWHKCATEDSSITSLQECTREAWSIIAIRCVSVLYLYLDADKPIAKRFFYVSMAFFVQFFVHMMQYCMQMLQLHIINQENFCTLCALCV